MRFYKKEDLFTCTVCQEKYMREKDKHSCETAHLKLEKVRKKLNSVSEESIREEKRQYSLDYYYRNQEALKIKNRGYSKIRYYKLKNGQL